jgi:protein tyrosine phosphatase (PTP) superfamily phosphohydrolase (DUF442 family)
MRDAIETQNSTPRAGAGARPAILALAGALLGALFAGCGDPVSSTVEAAVVSPPLTGVTNAYEKAAERKLPERKPEDHHDLHNVYHLSKNVISGSEPHGREGLERIASYGVKTILSVDGKAPDAKTAEELGMRYVHVPIQYKGITPGEILLIAKTFRELEGPFYVHCFHGKHRGPAAAAIGRVVLDGVPRDEAIAEMRQYCGTAQSYEGLYKVVAMGDVPSAKETAAVKWDFPAAHGFTGFRGSMIAVSRHYDNVEAMAKRKWEVDPDHPDLNPAHEATLVADALSQGLTCGEKLCENTEFAKMMSDSEAAARALSAALLGKADAWSATADREFKALKNLCSACHKVHRNE